ncbi:MAG: tRNA dihydrouridine synthase DusB [Candidatus Omnitrophica bacterium]|nr:tRNA dihydrouridine synthase DusB [Candidatus Omnitrophota bacterium]
MSVPSANVFEDLRRQSPVVLAPLSGITDAAFREVCRRSGCRFVYAEMTSSEALARGNDKAQGRIRGLDAPIPTVAQLLGNSPEVMAEAAEMCVEMGADAVDINLGCPARQIVRGGGGSALMREPETVAALVHAMTARISKPVSVKMRAGWDDNCRNAVDIARIAEGEGAKAITVHPRTRAQAFKGAANWEVIARVKEAVSVPVIGNGDVRTREDMLRMLESTRCDAVMVGRSALGQPWIFRKLEDPTFIDPDYETRIEVAIEHLRLLGQDKGDHRGAVEFRKHLACYLKSMPDNKFVREKMNRMDSVEEVVSVLREYAEGILACKRPMAAS